MKKYYIGSTSMLPELRLKQHLLNHKGFTSKAKDWEIVYRETYTSIEDARSREFQIKRWKSSLRIQQLITRSSTE
ncbi:MAG: GIY-YIG nuclease family protein [Chitinophagaceae bacterium]